MKIRLEGTGSECEAMAAIIRTIFDVKSTSKFYPNSRNSASDFEGRVYVALNGFAEKDLPDILANDMLGILRAYGDVNDAGKLAEIRQIYDLGKRGLGLGKLMQLYLAWRDNNIE